MHQKQETNFWGMAGPSDQKRVTHEAYSRGYKNSILYIGLSFGRRHMAQIPMPEPVCYNEELNQTAIMRQEVLGLNDKLQIRKSEQHTPRSP